MSDQQIAVVTGASSGIGAAVAARLAAAGYRVFGASRRAGDGETGPGSIEHVSIDLNDNDSVATGFGRIQAETGQIDVLVNCAGYLLVGGVEELSIEAAKAQFETNYFGVVRATLAVLPGMRERRSGHIVTVSSLAGLVPVPFWAHYNASKFAVEGLMESLRHEVRPHGVQVSLVEPGNIKTELYERPQPAGLAAYAGPRGRALAVMDGFGRKSPGPDVVAAKVAAIVADSHPALHNLVTKEARQFTRLRRVLPAGAFEAGVRRSFKLAGEG